MLFNTELLFNDEHDLDFLITTLIVVMLICHVKGLIICPLQLIF